jgi:hypothetical protein
MIDAIPVKVSCGLGVNSVAMLVGMRQAGFRPDAILFADIGCEMPETYAYRPILQRWLADVGFPPLVTVVKASPRCGDRTLRDECVRKGLLPAIAYGGHSCAAKWKIRPQDKWVNRWPLAIEAFRRGLPVRVGIGYDAGHQDERRKCRAYDAQTRKVQRTRWGGVKYRYWYPLQEWGWDRPACLAAIRSEGIPAPIKSACDFCMARKKPEIDAMIRDHPDVFRRCVEVEDAALPKLRSSKGLGRSFSWRTYSPETMAS